MKLPTSIITISLIIKFAVAAEVTIQSSTTCETNLGSGFCVGGDAIDACDGGFLVSGGCQTNTKCCIKQTCTTGKGDGVCVNSDHGCASGPLVGEGCPGRLRCCVQSDDALVERRHAKPQQMDSDSIRSTSQTETVRLQTRALPGLNEKQSGYAAIIASAAKQRGLGFNGCVVGVMTVFQETYFRNLGSMKFPSTHWTEDGLGNDYDSVGLFQQRWSQNWGQGNTAEEKMAWLLVPDNATAAFFERLVTVPGWQALPKGDACQAVQRSERPGEYAKHEPLSTQICQAIGGW